MRYTFSYPLTISGHVVADLDGSVQVDMQTATGELTLGAIHLQAWAPGRKFFDVEMRHETPTLGTLEVEIRAWLLAKPKRDDIVQEITEFEEIRARDPEPFFAND